MDWKISLSTDICALPLITPHKYRYWKHDDKSNETLAAILADMDASEKIWQRYFGDTATALRQTYLTVLLA